VTRISSLRIPGGCVRTVISARIAARGNLSLQVVLISECAPVFVDVLAQVQLTVTRIIPVQLIGVDEMLESRVNHDQETTQLMLGVPVIATLSPLLTVVLDRFQSAPEVDTAPWINAVLPEFRMRK
jgi:hypothetical protein